jgi:hypothetical protein
MTLDGTRVGNVIDLGELRHAIHVLHSALIEHRHIAGRQIGDATITCFQAFDQYTGHRKQAIARLCKAIYEGNGDVVEPLQALCHLFAVPTDEPLGLTTRHTLGAARTGVQQTLF